MLLLFGAVVFISGTDPKKLKDFINKEDVYKRQIHVSFFFQYFGIIFR